MLCRKKGDLIFLTFFFYFAVLLVRIILVTFSVGKFFFHYFTFITFHPRPLYLII